MDVICFGELMVDMVAKERGPLSDSKSFIKRAGGAAANVAVQASKLGAKVGYVGKLGGDEFSDYLINHMLSYGVDMSNVCRDNRKKATVAFISLDSKQVPHYLFYKENSASTMMEVSDLDESYLRKGKIFYFSSTILSGDLTRNTVYKALEFASGSIIAMDVNLRLSAWRLKNEAKDIIEKVITKVNILKINQDELLFLTDCESDEACKKILEGYPDLQLIILTKGDKGSTIFPKGKQSINVPAHDIKCIDTTGAGDSYMGTFLWGIAASLNSRDYDYINIAERATAAAEIVIGKEGTIEAMPNIDEISRFISDLH